MQAKVEDAKSKHKQAAADVKRIEREMTELQNDKGSKVKQIKADILQKKAEASKLEEVVDNLRNEVLTDELELGTTIFVFESPMRCD